MTEQSHAVRVLAYDKARELSAEEMKQISGGWNTSYTGITEWIDEDGDGSADGFRYSDSYYF